MNDVAKLREKVEKERQKRAQACQAAIEKALKDNNCQMTVAVLVTEQGNVPQISIVPLDPAPEE